MRTIVDIYLSILTVGCADPRPAAEIDRVELRVSGWSAVDLEVNSRGEGKYHLSEPFPDGKGGSFSIKPQQFTALVERLQPFRRQAVPFTDDSAQEFINRECPRGVPFVTDAGAVWVHWVGRNFDEHFLADLGCDPERNTARNRELLSVVESLPVPLDW
jgi:hypothetical protein